jgi:hypothetical protein
MAYNYPSWLRPTKFSSLEPGIREYWLRRVGYDTVYEDTHPGMKDGQILPDNDEAEKAIREWMYGKDLSTHIWCAKGFHQARSVMVDSDGNLGMSNDCQFNKMIHWLATMQWEESVDNNWLENTHSEEEFVEKNEWATHL